MKIRYLNANEIVLFFDKFEKDIIEFTGMDADELSELSRTEINESVAYREYISKNQ